MVIRARPLANRILVDVYLLHTAAVAQSPHIHRTLFIALSWPVHRRILCYCSH